MKLLVFADSHGRPGRMLEAAAIHAETAHACIFLGDGLRDAEQLHARFPQLPLYMVQGNCDYGTYQPLEGLAPMGGLLFLYTHGHAFQVKANLETLWWRAQRKGADVALFGHTHKPFFEKRRGIYLFCPGSIAMPRFGPPTYGLITLQNGVPGFEVVSCE